MTARWPIRKLIDIADIRVSNVDKKIHAGEKPVKLCNYMDVYSNEYVTGDFDFMEGSATTAEIERFGLKCGDVVITKDSETPDDIGIPAVISEAIDNLVCGYHLALIRPNEEVDSVYLAKQLSTSRVARYFAMLASGSTRYGLPISAIEKVGIPTPPIPEQSKIGEILSTVDRAIEEAKTLLAKRQRIKTGLMQDLLTRGIDEHGKLRSDSTHKFKDSPLGAIPLEWETKSLEQLTSRIVDGVHHTPTYKESGIPFIVITDLTGGSEISFSGSRFVSEKDHCEFSKRADPNPGDVLVTKDGTLGVARIVPSDAPAFSIFVSVAMLRPRGTLCLPELIWSFFESGEFLIQLGGLSAGTGLAHIHLEHFRKFLLRRPPLEEQRKIFLIISKQQSQVDNTTRELRKLLKIKSALMQDLLTGQKRVTPLLEPALTH